MSDLVEKVKEAVASNCELYEEEFDNAARAAIRAVLAHFAEAGNVTDGMVRALNDNTLSMMSGEGEDAIAAAMAAALKEVDNGE